MIIIYIKKHAFCQHSWDFLPHGEIINKVVYSEMFISAPEVPWQSGLNSEEELKKLAESMDK